MLRKLKWQIPRAPLVARYNWCQGPVPGHGPAVEKQCSKPVCDLNNSKTQFLLHREQCTSITKLNRLGLMLHKEIIANCSQQYTKCINTFCGQHTQIPNVKSNGIYSGHCALTFNNSTLCPQCALMCFILLTEWTAITPYTVWSL